MTRSYALTRLLPPVRGAVALLAAGVLLTACTGGEQPADIAAPAAPAAEAPVEAPAADGAATTAKRISETGVVTIDVRTPEEFAQGHVDGARNIDVSAGAFREQVSALPRDGRYVAYCRSGNRSAAAITIMRELGFTDLTDGGGLDALLAAGAPAAS